MNKRLNVLLILSVLLVLFAAACSDSTSLYPAEDGLDGATVFAEQCGKCHALDLAKQVTYDSLQWEEAVERMVIKGATLSEEEQVAVTDYLIEKYAK